MEVQVIQDINIEPVTLAEAKAFCRIDADYTADDAALNAFIISARERLEKFTNLSFGIKTLKCQFSTDMLVIPYAPVVSIISLTNNENPPVIVDADKYKVVGLDFKTIYVRSLSNAEFFYPITGGFEFWSVENTSCVYNLNYQAGYGGAGTPLPKSLKTAILVQVNEDYKNLGNPMLEELSPVAKQIAQPYSRNLLFQ